MANLPDIQADQEELSDDIVLLFDWDMQDRLIAMAKNEDEAKWDVVVQEYEEGYLADQLNESALDILQRIYRRCRSIMPKQPLSNPPNQLVDLMQTLFYVDPSPQKELLKRQVLPAIKVIRWLRAKRAEVLIPKMLEKLKAIFEQYFTDKTANIEAKFFGRLARDMIRALPNIEWPNEQFTKDASEMFNLTKDSEENDDQFALRVSDVLYYYQLLCHLLVAAQKYNDAGDDALIDLKTALTLAPPILKSLLIRSDIMLKNMVLPEEAIESFTARLQHSTNTQPIIKPQPDQSPMLDIS